MGLHHRTARALASGTSTNHASSERASAAGDREGRKPGFPIGLGPAHVQGPKFGHSARYFGPVRQSSPREAPPAALYRGICRGTACAPGRPGGASPALVPSSLP